MTLTDAGPLYALVDATQTVHERCKCDGVSNGYMSMLAVAEDKRGQGIGRAIVSQLMVGDEDDDVTWVLRAGRQSGGFWQKLGFEPLERGIANGEQDEIGIID